MAACAGACVILGMGLLRASTTCGHEAVMEVMKAPGWCRMSNLCVKVHCAANHTQAPCPNRQNHHTRCMCRAAYKELRRHKQMQHRATCMQATRTPHANSPLTGLMWGWRGPNRASDTFSVTAGARHGGYLAGMKSPRSPRIKNLPVAHLSAPILKAPV